VTSRDEVRGAPRPERWRPASRDPAGGPSAHPAPSTRPWASPRRKSASPARSRPP